MKPHIFFALAAVSSASLALWPALARAQDESPTSVEYIAPTPDCVSNDAFQALVKAEMAHFPSSDRGRRPSVRIVPQDGLYAGTLTTENGAVRTVTAARCEDVTAALAVIIAVAEPSGPAPAATPSTPAKGSTPVHVSQPGEPDRDPAGSVPGLDWRVGARGFTSTQNPNAAGFVGVIFLNAGGMGTVSLELPWGFRKMMFEVGGGMSTVIGGNLAYTTASYLILDTQSCLLDLPIGSTGLSVLGCVRLDGVEFRSMQTLSASPSTPGVPVTNNGVAFWMGASARLRWQSSGLVFVEGNVDGMYGTASFAADSKPAWLALGLGVGLRI
jgi:hypothetical protein